MAKSFTTTRSTQPSPAFFELLGNCLKDILIQTDEQGRIRTCNEATHTLLGYAKEKLIGMHLSDIIPAGVPRECSLADIAKGLPIFEDHPLRTPCEIRTRGGQTVLATVIATTLRNSSAEDRLLVVTIQDVPETESPEKPDRDDHQVSAAGMYILQSGKFKFANQQFQQYLGFSEEDLKTIAPASRIHPNDREKVRQNAMSMLKDNRFEGYEFRFVNRDGEIRWAHESVMLITHHGRAAILGSFVDITEVKESATKASS